jgi:ATP-binding cassette subfamily C protein
MLKDLRAIASWLDGRDRIRWFLLVPLVSAAAIVEAIGALAVFGLLRVVVEPGRIKTTPVLSDLWLRWPNGDAPSLVAALTIAVAVFYVARALFLVWVEWVKESVVHHSGARVAERLFARYLAADYAFHLRRRSAALIEEVSRSTDLALQFIAASVVNIFAEVATLAALTVVLLLTAPSRTLAAVGIVLAVVAIPVIATRRVWTRWGERSKRFEEQQLHVLQQSLGAVKEVKIAGREAFFESRLRAARRALAQVRQQRASIASALRLGVEATLIVAMLLIILVVTMRGDSGAESVSVLALFAYTGFRAVPSANRIMLNAGYIREGGPFARAVAADFARLGRAATRPHGPEPTLDFRHSIECRNVSFEYEETGRPALHDINLAVRRGESVGIVGPTGAGKSTLVDVMLGLLRPTAGQVLIDGDDLAGYERAWQRLIGYVPQDPYLLDDTVRRNIAFGVPDSVIDEQRLARACTLAQLDDFLGQLPDGLETTVGDDGVRLSGGQRQRVAIARALYQDPAVIVFDEATAALDNQTERDLTRAIAALHGERTLLVIAHRLTTVESCDRLIFLRDGRLAGVGPYQELLRDPRFKALAVP